MTVPSDKILSRKGRAFLELVLTLPPTDNHIYFNATTTKRGYKQSIRVKSEEAKRYERSVASQVAEMAIYNQIEFKKNVPYLIYVKVFFEDVENKGWLKGEAGTRYKKVDTANRNKLLTDAIMQAIGVDDSHIFPVIKFKDVDHNDPRVEVQVYELTEHELQELRREIDDTIQRVLWD